MSWRTRSAILILLATVSIELLAQKKIACPDGEHLEINVNQIALKYDGSSFSGTLNGLSVLGGHLNAIPTRLQEAAAATQQWDVFLKGLAEGYNKCAVTRQQYFEGLNRIYPRLKEDVAGLEQIRKAITDGRKADEKQLKSLLDSYYASLRRLAQLSGKEVILDRIEAVSEQVRGVKGDTELILEKLNRLEERERQAPLATPAEVGNRISEIRENLLARADEAENAYNKGYECFERYQFQESIPYLQQAVASVPLPDFYLALGRAYEALPDLVQAEDAARKGLSIAEKGNDDKKQAELADLLGIVLFDRGNLEEALKYAQHALDIDEKSYGPDHPTVAIRANNIGQILREKGDLDEALKYGQRALIIDEKIYGPDHPNVARDVGNIGGILWDKGDLDGALTYSLRALTIAEKVYGPDHPRVATFAGNVGAVLAEKGDLDEALRYSKRALQIDEQVYGLDHPDVATRTNNIGQILREKGDLDEALKYGQRALQIDQKLYGNDHPRVAVDLNNIGQILQAKGDLKGALNCVQQALKIDEKTYGPDHPTVAIRLGNIGQILKAEGNLEEALKYNRRALEIDEKVYGSGHPVVAVRASNIGQILKDKGDLDGALYYTQRALKILMDSYGPNNPTTRDVANNLQQIIRAQQALKK